MKEKALFYIIIFLFFIQFNAFYAQKSNAVKAPNFIVFFADDAGYGDFGFTGSKEFKTPNIDKLAKQGVKFTNAYVSSPVCGPSRAGLLTGKYQQRFGFIHNNVPYAIDKQAGLSGEKMGLPKEIRTIANYLGDKGYKSIILGKWHQGHGAGFHPLDRGFDEFYGFLGGARSYFEEKEITQENQLWRNRQKIPEPGGYLTDHLADEASKFIQKNKDTPFFMYLAFNAIHGPFDAKRKDKEKFSNLTGNRQNLAAMALSMDQAIGKVLNTLEELNLDKNTVIVFTNDNGGPCWSGMNNAPFSGCKASCLEGGVRVPFIMKWADKLSQGQIFEAPIITLDILPTFLELAGSNNINSSLFDGKDLMPYLLKEKSGNPHETLYWEFDGNISALRYKNWKLIRMPDRPVELYNLEKDITESENIAFEEPKIVRELMKKLFEWHMKNERPRWQLKVEPYDRLPSEIHEKYRKN